MAGARDPADSPDDDDEVWDEGDVRVIEQLR
jgi:hypothetical protein